MAGYCCGFARPCAAFDDGRAVFVEKLVVICAGFLALIVNIFVVKDGLPYPDIAGYWLIWLIPFYKVYVMPCLAMLPDELIYI